MTPENQSQKDDNLDILAAHLLGSNQPEPEIPEPLLWAHALNALEIPQREYVLNELARSEKAREMLERIERSIVVATARPASIEASIKKRVIEALARLGQDLSTVAGVVAAKGGRLVAAFGKALADPETLAAPATLGAAIGETAPTRVIGPQGMSLAITPRDEDLFEIGVAIEPAVEGKVALFKFEIQDGELVDRQIGIKRKLQEGHTLLSDCPTGLIKVVAPDSREIILYLESCGS